MPKNFTDYQRDLALHFEPRVLTLLYMATEIQRSIKEDFEKLT